MKIDNLVQFANDLFNEKNDVYREMRHRTYFRNQLYVIGEQYIVFDKTALEFRRAALPEYIPTPVSNICRDYLRAEKNLLLADYMISAWPASNSVKDRNSAKMVESLLRYLDLANNSDFLNEREKFAEIAIICGTGFMRTYPSADKSQFPYAEGKMIRSGEVVREAVLPFSVFVDPYGTKLSNMRYVGIRSMKPKEWVEDTFHENIVSENIQDRMPYEYTMSQMIGNVSKWKGWGVTVNTPNIMDMDESVVYKEIEFAPSVQNPEGRYVVVVGDKILYDMDRLPIQVEKSDGQVKWSYTLSDYHHQPNIGSYWGDSGLNDLISPQNTINDIDRQLAMNRVSMGRTIITEPLGANLKTEIISGQPFNLIQYDPKLAYNHKPEIHHAMSLPNQVLDERAIQKQVIQDASGDPKNVLSGNVPTSDASGLLFEAVKETAKESHIQDIQRFRRALEAVYRNAAVCAKELYTDARKLKINEGDRIEVINIKSSDIRDNTDIRLEPINRIATTRAGQAVIVTNMVNAGMYGDISMDPETRNMVLELSGSPKIRDKMTADVERAIYENDLIASVKVKIEGSVDVMGEPYPLLIGEAAETVQWGYMPVDENGKPMGSELYIVNIDDKFRFDNHQLHWDSHRRFILSKEFDKLDPLQKELLMRHTMAHENTMWIRQQQEMQVQMMTQQAMAQQGQPEQRGQEVNLGEAQFPEPEEVA